MSRRVDPTIYDQRPLPVNQKAEQNVIATLLSRAAWLPEIHDIVTPADFFDTRNRHIFHCIRQLFRHNVSDTLDGIWAELEAQDLLESAGGSEYILELAGAAGVSRSGLQNNARLVKEAALKRRLIDQAYGMLEDNYNPAADVFRNIESSADALMQVAGILKPDSFHLPAQSAQDTFAYINTLQALDDTDAEPGVKTGIAELDQHITRIENGCLAYIYARPSQGKTALALQIVRHAVFQQNVPTLYISAETPYKQLSTRILCAEAKVNTMKVRRGRGSLSHAELKRLTTKTALLQDSPLYIDDDLAPTDKSIYAKCRLYARKYKLGLIVFDFLQRMLVPSEKQTEQISTKASNTLKIIAGELDIPVIGLSQLNRDSARDQNNKRPELHHGRYSGALEQDADYVFGLWRPEKDGLQTFPNGDNAQGMAEITILKQRDGPTGEHIRLPFAAEWVSFEKEMQPKLSDVQPF